MKKRQQLALATGAAAAMVAVLASGATAAKVSDERSDGTIYDAKAYAACDVRELEAETAGGTLQVTVTVRGKVNPGASLTVSVDTRGGNGSEPEYVARGEALMTYSNTPRTVGRSTTSATGRQVVVTIPLAAIGRPRRVGVQVSTCGEAANDIAPGGDHFDGKGINDRPVFRYLFATPAERVVEGEVELLCAASGRSCRRLPVEGATVRAVGGSPRRTYETATDRRGQFSFGVDKGIYTVTAADDLLQVRGGARRVDVRRARSGAAAFTACGLKPAAQTSAVTGGVWRGGNADCLNYFEIAWRPSSGVSVTWASAPICTGAGGNWVGPGKVLMKGIFLDPQAQGTNVVVGANDIQFHSPIQSVSSGNSVSGTLRANGSGVVTARYVEGLCTFGISRLPLKR
ncbi:carboxypeptidase-like regulatory domain-containing protein [Conexibacter sp. JD483]|uniref:carboxypeptidase-like regulatory domain-containing protein n=1 Tax=unclassified Conexibacter TaxID=2627773 RepID=UPI00271A2D6C|nr:MULTISPECIES: carboxypeptidase-like regulatory domain-containing protein [unclassified Conexibacter]MDO8185160.1 carboxypeptidase-like regulatory domain-containing protein [Conexibacter sp. CPCC 205706]MDO8196870.1 carboxypeptidase-like regulatory domain-containing protein [Conexibacter sp. CPCC 205762]MDR9368646.1 carboxypeptidase-like regulatory domain-containing protein [Conexibacter sp. JD483]